MRKFPFLVLAVLSSAVAVLASPAMAQVKELRVQIDGMT
jgi:hypothetical protein